MEAACKRRLAARIAAAGGALRFDHFMAFALYDPECGYYTCKPTVLGSAGDFTTASEMSPIFAATLARGIAPQLAALERPRIVEFGAGSGRFAAALLHALGHLDQLPERYVICDVSPRLAALQQAFLREAVAELPVTVTFESASDCTPAPGVLVANEVLDALPVRRFVCRSAGLAEQWVVAEGAGVALRERPLARGLAERLRARYGACWDDLEEGSEVEINARMLAFLRTLKRVNPGGAIWLSDYGEPRTAYYHAGRTRGTLLCHRNHEISHDPLTHIGQQDITASVDFTRVAEVASAFGLEVRGFATQAHALVTLGVDSVVAGLSEDARLDAVAALKTLLLPGQMGERVKLMVLAAPELAYTPLFDPFDMRHRL